MYIAPFIPDITVSQNPYDSLPVDALVLTPLPLWSKMHPPLTLSERITWNVCLSRHLSWQAFSLEHREYCLAVDIKEYEAKQRACAATSTTHSRTSLLKLPGLYIPFTVWLWSYFITIAFDIKTIYEQHAFCILPKVLCSTHTANQIARFYLKMLPA